MKLSLWSKWYLSHDKQLGPVIRRYRTIGGKIKWQRYKASPYRHLSKDDLSILLTKLNARQIAEENVRSRFQYDTSFLTPGLMDKFELELKSGSTSKGYVKHLLYVLHTYALAFLIQKKKIADPKQWPKVQAEWGEWLQQQDIGLKSIIATVQVTNRLLRFLHLQEPDLMPLVHLEPVRKGVRKTMKAKQEKIGTFIPDDEWKRIEENISEEIKAGVQLAYYYGLRRSEILGVKHEDLFNGYLYLRRTIAGTNPIRYAPLKNREKRKTPHWFALPDFTFKLIADLRIMHFSTFASKFQKEIERMMRLPKAERINQRYELHDLRRTFITKALRGRDGRDVQLAVGHADLRTTMAYAQDDRDLSDAPYVPTLTAVKDD